MTGRQLIHASGTIMVNKDVASVFTFFANPANDHHWRKEINKSILDGPLEAGVTFSEYSYLSKRAPNHVLEFICVQFDKNKVAVFETLGHSRFYEKSQRMVKAVADQVTAITYTLDFDKSIVQFALGFPLPGFVISWKANSDLKKYLRQLKRLVEQGKL